VNCIGRIGAPVSVYQAQPGTDEQAQIVGLIGARNVQFSHPINGFHHG
jgi:hypothetical protein